MWPLVDLELEDLFFSAEDLGDQIVLLQVPCVRDTTYLYYTSYFLLYHMSYLVYHIDFQFFKIVMFHFFISIIELNILTETLYQISSLVHSHHSPSPPPPPSSSPFLLSLSTDIQEDVNNSMWRKIKNTQSCSIFLSIFWTEAPRDKWNRYTGWKIRNRRQGSFRSLPAVFQGNVTIHE